jgi:hypothetical protein
MDPSLRRDRRALASALAVYEHVHVPADAPVLVEHPAFKARVGAFQLAQDRPYRVTGQVDLGSAVGAVLERRPERYHRHRASVGGEADSGMRLLAPVAVDGDVGSRR